ncbi:MAG: ABC transporter substrate-binding protein [Rhodospirillaceae bacterium]|jgi:NitT/TauT family transport system substrate-binding protein|nr:ABC transporter substrate-binding protein [Rhodospirillaceae bacterium]
MSIKLFENFRALFYAPYYAAFEIGAYKDKGVDVEFALMEGSGSGGQAVVDGADAVTWGGPMRVLLDHDQNPDSELVSFCEVVGKDPFLILGQEPNPNFELADIVDIRFANFIEAPTPWNCLQEDLRRVGIDPASLNRVSDQSITDNISAFKSGELDAVQVLEPYAQILIDGGHGHIWFEGASRGPCSYTTFYAKRSMLDARQDELGGMYAAIAHTLRWVQEVTSEEIVKAITPYFPDDDSGCLASAIARYKNAGLWNKTPVLSEIGLGRLRAGLLSNSFIKRDVPYDEMVDTRFD